MTNLYNKRRHEKLCYLASKYEEEYTEAERKTAIWDRIYEELRHCSDAELHAKTERFRNNNKVYIVMFRHPLDYPDEVIGYCYSRADAAEYIQGDEHEFYINEVPELGPREDM